jgi:hypothetical protein
VVRKKTPKPGPARRGRQQKRIPPVSEPPSERIIINIRQLLSLRRRRCSIRDKGRIENPQGSFWIFLVSDDGDSCSILVSAAQIALAFPGAIDWKDVDDKLKEEEENTS